LIPGSQRTGLRSKSSSEHIQPIGILQPWVSRNLAVRDSAQVSERRNQANVSWGFSDYERSKIMPLIQLLEVLIVVGVLLWLVNRFIPMQGTIKSILNGVVVIAVVLWLLNVFGLFHSLSRIRIGT
jgi:hypothetical protein